LTHFMPIHVLSMIDVVLLPLSRHTPTPTNALHARPPPVHPQAALLQIQT
jgi:hypothetical protein